jgi:hypothetical protein
LSIKPPEAPNAVFAESGLYRFDLIEDFGAFGDEENDDWPAFQAAAEAIRDSPEGAIIEIPNPPVGYRISDEIDCFIPSSAGKRQIWRGQDDVLTVIRPDFAGRDKALFRCVDVSGAASTLRHSPVEFQGGMYLRHMSQAVAHPVFVWVHGAGEFRQSGRLRLGGTNNTALRLNGAQNMRGDLIYNDSGGHVWNYKPLDGVTFTVNGTTTITASSGVFTAGDVGKILWLHRTNSDFQTYRFTIATYVGPTQVTLDIAAPAATSAVYRGFFEPPALTVGSGSHTATVDGNGCFVAGEDEGTRVFIGQATGDLFVTSIASVTSATQVELADAAPAAITAQPFCTPGIEITGWDFPSGATKATDIRIETLHIENGTAVPLLLKDCIQTWIGGKIENESSPDDDSAPDGAMWIDAVEGEFHGDLSGVNSGRHRVMVWDQEHPFGLRLKTRRGQGETMVRLHDFSNANGSVHWFGSGTFINNDASANLPWHLCDDDNGTSDPRFAAVGPFETDTTTERTRVALGSTEGLYADLSGNLYGLGDTLPAADLTSDLGSSTVRFGRAFLAHYPNIPVRGPLTANTTLDSQGFDALITIDTTSGAVTVTPPSAVAIKGRRYTIKKLNAGANNVVIDPNGAETIDGAATLTFNTQWQTVRIISDGSNWLVL